METIEERLPFSIEPGKMSFLQSDCLDKSVSAVLLHSQPYYD
jgi:hypothetical protein